MCLACRKPIFTINNRWRESGKDKTDASCTWIPKRQWTIFSSIAFVPQGFRFSFWGASTFAKANIHQWCCLWLGSFQGSNVGFWASGFGCSSYMLGHMKGEKQKDFSCCTAQLFTYSSLILIDFRYWTGFFSLLTLGEKLEIFLLVSRINLTTNQCHWNITDLIGQVG